jgi:hypothetical protein
MTQQNLLEVTKKKLQKFYWPVWFPFPSSWLKAFILAIFMRVIIVVIQNTGELGYRIANFTKSPELFVIFAIMAILSPIVVISFTHHCLHLFISCFIPEIQALEIGKTQGLLPGIMSWWEGLYGWLVIILSKLIATCISIIFFPFSNLSYIQYLEYYIPFNERLFVIFSIFYLIIGALIYQLEYLVKRRVI